MLTNIIMNFTTKITDAIDEKTKTVDEITKSDLKIENPFKLPIEYLDQNEQYKLSDIVCEDLELSEKLVDLTTNNNTNDSSDSNSNNSTMYHYLLNPTNEFALNVIPKWKTTITTNTHFLEETQQIIHSMDSYKTIKMRTTITSLSDSSYTPDYKTIMQIWHDTKEDPNFLERYSYMEIEMFKCFNKMPSFLQAISIVNMGSPILSFMIPFILFLFPFVILKIQGIPITFSIYLSVLKDISKNHFIGKLISNAEKLSIENMLYIVLLLGLYGYQIYQNYVSCIRFYKNISRINGQICEMQKYLQYSITNMELFSIILKDKKNHQRFYDDLSKHLMNLKNLKDTLQTVKPFEPSISKIGEIGVLLGCYYELYSNMDYEKSLQYSFDFEGYMNNLVGIYDNLNNNKIGIAEFYDNVVDLSGNPLVIKEQYYPALIHDNPIKNDACIDTNMIITGPNAAGKTTFLKTTILNIIFTQQFGCGFYSTCKIKPYTHIHSYLNIPDTSGRDSLFQAESRRCKDIINIIVNNSEKTRHFGIFDELYSGTNPIEATKSAYSFLLYLAKFENVDFILTTHYVDICNRLTNGSNRISNWKMDAEMDHTGDITYKYTISKGVSSIQGATKVLRDMNYPEEIIQNIIDYDNIKEQPSIEEQVAPTIEEQVAPTIVEQPIKQTKDKRKKVK